MNASLRAHRAYAAGATPVRTPKSIEYDAVAHVTRKLRNAQAMGDSGFPALAAALEQNRKLWQIFAMEVASGDNGLPQTLRAQIFYLAEFTFAHTRKVLARTEPVTDLIDVNTAILRGLKPKGA